MANKKDEITLEERHIFSTNLQRYMDEHGKSRSALAEETGIKYATLCEWINERKYPRVNNIQLLANYFGIKKSDLTEKKKNTKEIKAHRIPVYGKVAAGFPLDMVEDIIGFEEIPAKWGDPSDYFCLQIEGNSMEPRILSGDVVVVRKQADADTGDVVIYSVNGEAASCKRLRKMDDGLMFIPFNNDDHFPQMYNWEEVKDLPVQILGKVIELRGKF